MATANKRKAKQITNGKLTVDALKKITRGELQKRLLAIEVDNVDTSDEITIQDFIDAGCIVEGYEPIAKAYAKSQADYNALSAAEQKKTSPPSPVTIHIVPNVEIILKLLRANGRNRKREWPHVATVAHSMQQGYAVEFTDVAVTIDNKTANGGHSTAAFCVAFLPRDFFTWAKLHPTRQVKMTENDEGEEVALTDTVTRDGVEIEEPVYETVYTEPPLPAAPVSITEGAVEVKRTTYDGAIESEKDGIITELSQLTDEERLADYNGYLDAAFSGQRAGVTKTADGKKVTTRLPAFDPSRRVMRVCFGVAPDAVAQYDTVARGRQASEQLYIFPATRHLINTFPAAGLRKDTKAFSSVIKALHMRCKVPTDKCEKIDEAKGLYKFGNNRGGGRTDPKNFTGFTLAHLKRLENIRLAIDMGSMGDVQISHEIPMIAHPSCAKDVYVALASVDPDSAVALAEALMEDDKKERNPLLKSLNRMLDKTQRP